MKYIKILLLLYSFGAYAQSPYIPRALPLLNNGVEVMLSTEYSRTDSVADVDGDESKLFTGESGSQIDIDLNLGYGLTNNLQLNLGLKARQVQSTFLYDGGSGEEELSLSNSGLESTFIGFKYGFDEVERSRFSLEGWYRFPAYSNEIYVSGEPDTIALGEGSREYAIGGSYSVMTKASNVLEASLFYRSPGEDISPEFLTTISYSLVGKRFALYGGYEYLKSTEDDAYTDDINSKPRVFQGVTSKYNSINRQWSAPFIGLNVALGKTFRIETRYTQVISGVSTDLGPRVLVSLVRRSERLGNDHTRRDAQFKEYSIEAVVEKISKSRKVVIINKGAAGGVEKGMKIDFYYFDFLGGNELIATGVVLKTKLNKSIIKIRKRYSKKRMEEGIVARGGLTSSAR